MTPELWQRLKPLFNAALDAPEEDRPHLVQQLCAGDVELAHELNALLAADSRAGQTLGTPLDPSFDPNFDPLSLLPAFRPPVLAPGTRLARRFLIVRHLGSGGMGDVYEALDEQLEAGRIALKTIQPAVARNPLALARFKDEVRVARQVTGPNVCRIHELYLADPQDGPDAVAFLTMELLEGTTLHERIADSTPMPIAGACTIASQLCTALNCIHSAGIVHQDLKPRNVMLVPSPAGERVVVMDFGLARTAVASLSATGTHSPGLIAGTPGYMAPEQFEGRAVGPATDIYAFGLILYEMVTGIQPYAAHTPLAAAIRRSKPPEHASAVRRDLPPAWDKVIQRCLCFDPEERFPSASAAYAALTDARHITLRLGDNRRVTVRKRTLWFAAALLAVVFLTGGWWRFGRAPHRELAPDAAHWYALGIAALREGSYLKATRLLTTVVERDPTYALAHAELADAWTELDFTANAQREMLLASAPDEQKGLNDLERRYIDAVRTTMVRDYSAAAQDYEAILQKLPADSKAQGYVDLGRIYEKAGKVQETLKSYETAARLNPDDPAPFLHLGILRSRLRDPDAAGKAFDRAEQLYSAESDLGGLAEVAYQRGYAANESAGSAAARGYLERALGLARQIPSPQQEARSLSQLSTVSYYSGKFDDAEHYAAQVKEIASSSGLEYWDTDARIRLGNTYLFEGKLQQAEVTLTEALHQAQQNGHPRLEAGANMSISSLRARQDRVDDQIAYAQKAMRYYRDYGFLDAADRALVLIGRAQRDKGDYGAARKTAEDLLATAAQTGSRQFIVYGHELLGSIHFQMQNYPQALSSFQQALAGALLLNRTVAAQQSHCVDALWRLGRYNDAQQMLASYKARRTVGDPNLPAFLLSEAEMQLSREEYASAIQSAEQALLLHDTETDVQAELLTTLARAYIYQRNARQAQLAIGKLDDLAHTDGDPEALAASNLVTANLALAENEPQKAERLSQLAASFYNSRHKPESELFSRLVEIRALRLENKGSIAVAVSQQALDLLAGLQQSWGNEAFQGYLKRPDAHRAYLELTSLRTGSGVGGHALP